MSFSERELEEIESLSFLIKSILTDSQSEGWRVWDAIQKLDEIGRKIISRNIANEDIPECLALTDMKELLTRLTKHIIYHLNEEDSHGRI